MLSVILATYNNQDIEERCVAALLASDCADRFRVVVIDDRSSSTTPAGLRPYHDLRFRLPARGGPHLAWNIGAAVYPHDDFVLVGSDVVVRPETIRFLAAFSQAKPDIGLVAATDYKTSPKTIPAPHPSLPARPVPVPGIESCCLIRRWAWDKVGQFDPQFFRTFGDSDWNQRAEDLGVSRVRLPGVFVYHGCSVSRKREGVEADLTLDREDHVRFLQKWAARPDVIAKHPMPDAETARALKAHFWSVEGEK